MGRYDRICIYKDEWQNISCYKKYALGTPVPPFAKYGPDTMSRCDLYRSGTRGRKRASGSTLGQTYLRLIRFFSGWALPRMRQASSCTLWRDWRKRVSITHSETGNLRATSGSDFGFQFSPVYGIVIALVRHKHFWLQVLKLRFHAPRTAESIRRLFGLLVCLVLAWHPRGWLE